MILALISRANRSKTFWNALISKCAFETPCSTASKSVIKTYMIAQKNIVDINMHW